MRWRITTGFLLCLVGTAMFFYGVARHETTMRLSQAANYAVWNMFYGDKAPIPITKETEQSVLELRSSLRDLGGKYCWSLQAFEVCLLGFLLITAGLFIIRIDILGGQALASQISGSLTIDECRRFSFAITLFHAGLLIVLFVFAVTFGDNFCQCYKDWGRLPPKATRLALDIVHFAKKYSFFMLLLLILEYHIHVWLLRCGRQKVSRIVELVITCLIVGIIYFCFFGFYLPIDSMCRVTIVK
jgi:hypothetical protein